MSQGWKKTPNSRPTITISIDEDLLNRIIDYQFENRIPSRSQALNELIKKGILEMEQDKD